jgi:hypothetical protein
LRGKETKKKTYSSSTMTKLMATSGQVALGRRRRFLLATGSGGALGMHPASSVSRFTTCQSRVVSPL